MAKTMPSRDAALRKNMVVVLDMDETLIHTLTQEEREALLEDHTDITSELMAEGVIYPVKFNRYVGDGDVDEESEMLITRRPGVEEFIDKLDKVFGHVVVWSAGRKDYVERVLDKLFVGHRNPDLVMTYDDIMREPNGYYSKPLTKLYSKLPAAGPENTLIVDDCKSNFIHNPDNGLYIKAFAPSVEDLVGGDFEKDDHLFMLADYFTAPRFKQTKDVRELNFEKAFFRHIHRPRTNFRDRKRDGLAEPESFHISFPKHVPPKPKNLSADAIHKLEFGIKTPVTSITRRAVPKKYTCRGCGCCDECIARDGPCHCGCDICTNPAESEEFGIEHAIVPWSQSLPL